MTSVTQRITQYNKEAGQPRGGLVNPKLLTATQLEDEHGVLDHKQENVHASVVGLAVDYLSRLARIRVGAGEEAARAAVDVFRASLMGAQRITDSGGYPSAVEDARQAVLSLNINEHEDSTVGYAIDETAALIACQLATYDVGLRAGVGFTGEGAAIDTTTASGKLVFGIFAALAEFERELIRERTLAGLAAARARGRRGGRPYKMTAAKIRLAMASMGQPDTSVGDLCKELGVSRQTLYRHVSPTGELRDDGHRVLTQSQRKSDAPRKPSVTAS